MVVQGFGILLGAAIGAWIGMSRSCTTGTCPLTSNPYLGGMYGGLMGYLIVTAFLNHATTSWNPTTEDNAMATLSQDTVTSISSKAEFNQHVLGSSVPVLVDMWATWCGPCRAQLPIVEQVAGQAGEKARVVKVNVDDVPDVASDLGVTSIPTLLVFQGGKEVRRLVGLQSAASLSSALGL